MGQQWKTRKSARSARSQVIRLTKMQALALFARLCNSYDVALMFLPRNDPRFPILQARVEQLASEVEERHSVTIETEDDSRILADSVNNSPLHDLLVNLLHEGYITDAHFKTWSEAMSSVTLLLKSNGIAAKRFPT